MKVSSARTLIGAGVLFGAPCRAHILLYGMGKSSFDGIGRLLGVSGVAVYKWVRREAEALPDPIPDAEIGEMELDKMWHFLRSKKQALDMEGPESWHAAPCRLGCRWS